MKQYLYETHLHTSPVSRCASADVSESLEYYRSLGYDGVFITNHFIDGNIGCECGLTYEEKIHFYFSDYEMAVKIGQEIGISVFCGIESTYLGTDFLIYGLNKEWFLSHPEITTMQRSEMLTFMAENGALIIQAHPFREAFYIDHIRLFPRHVHGVEIYNAERSDEENAMAKTYAEYYNLILFAGSDNHVGDKKKRLAGMQSSTKIISEDDFIKRVLNNELTPFFHSI